MLTRLYLFNQAMHCSMSCRALVLVGVVALVALVAAFYQSTPCSAVTTGPTSRQRVEPGPFPLNSMHQAALFGHFLFEPPCGA